MKKISQSSSNSNKSRKRR